MCITLKNESSFYLKLIGIETDNHATHVSYDRVRDMYDPFKLIISNKLHELAYQSLYNKNVELDKITTLN